MKRITHSQKTLSTLGILGEPTVKKHTYNGKPAYPMNMLGMIGISRKLIAMDYVEITKEPNTLALIFEGNSELTPVITIPQLFANEVEVKFGVTAKPANQLTGKEWNALLGTTIELVTFADNKQVWRVKDFTHLPIAVSKSPRQRKSTLAYGHSHRVNG